MKRKILSIILISCLSLSLVACGESKTKEENETTSTTTNVVSEEVKEESSEKSSETIEEVEVVNFDDIGYLKDETVVNFDDYQKISLKIGPTVVTEEDIESQSLSLLEEVYKYKSIMDKVIETGDKICIDFVGTIDGKEFEGGNSDGLGYVFEVGNGGFIEGFEEGIVGSKPGDVIVNTIKFPEDYGVDELNGKEAQFTITINFVCGEEQEVSLTDDFLKNNTKFQTVDEFKAIVKTYLEKLSLSNYEMYKEEYKKTALLEYILKNVDIVSLKKEDVQAYYDMSVSGYEQMAASYGYTMDMFCQTFLGVSSNDFYASQKQTALDYVTFKGACEYIAEKEKIVVSDDDLNFYLGEIAKENDLTVEEVEMDMVENNARTQVLEEILQRKIMEYLLSFVETN